MRLTGIAASPGIVIGPALVMETEEFKIVHRSLSAAQRAAEVERLSRAIAGARGELEALQHKVEERLGEKFTHLFDAHLMMLEDRAFIGETERRIVEHGENAEWALKQVVDELLAVFASLEDAYMSERGGDVQDVYHRLQVHLAGAGRKASLDGMEQAAIIVTHALSPSDTALLNTEKVIGFVTEIGGRTSHTAVIANALEIPAVVGLHDVTRHVQTGDLLIVDGTRGTVLIDPDLGQQDEAEVTRTAYAERDAEYTRDRDIPAVTLDGVAVALRANIELPGEVPTACKYGAAGIGLYRSEFLFLNRSPVLPTEEDHFEVYSDLADRVTPHPCVIRTLDLGGEKYFHQVLDRDEPNPVMGMRAIRLCLRRRDIFMAQLRGVLRAAVGRSIRVMFPLISGVAELRQARELLAEAERDLRREGIAVPKEVKVGIMIEVPSAAMVADLLAREVDFFSIGTNDLIQYLLAIDRSNESVAYLYEPLHPAVLRMLRFVVGAARDAGIEVSLCGEMASDPALVPVLVGLGLRDLSVNPLTIPVVKNAIRQTDAGAAESMVERLLAAGTTAEVERILAAGTSPPPLSDAQETS